jgi:hypothetical protein
VISREKIKKKFLKKAIDFFKNRIRILRPNGDIIIYHFRFKVKIIGDKHETINGFDDVFVVWFV